MKRTPIKPGSFRRLLRNLRKDSEGDATPIQALRAKQRPGFHFGVDWDGPCLTGKIEQPDQAKNRPAKRSTLPRSSSLRAKQRRQYNKEGKAYLLTHPFCQITIALLCMDEAQVIKHGGYYYGDNGRLCQVPKADQLHHRNKTNGIRLLNFDYIMTAAAEPHHWTENNLGVARKLGLLCPINCKPDGTMPDGPKQPTTTELLDQRHQQKS